MWDFELVWEDGDLISDSQSLELLDICVKAVCYHSSYTGNLYARGMELEKGRR